MAFTPALTTKIWRKTRPRSCKATGVGKAIDQFNKACKDSPDTVSPEKFAAASAAATELNEKLDDAQKKINLKKDPKQGKATNTLISSWQKELKLYRSKLDTRKAQVVSKVDEKIAERTQALEIAKVAKKKFTSWAATVAGHVVTAAKQVKAAEKSRKNNEMMQNSMAIDAINRCRTEAEKALKEANSYYDDNFKKGIVLSSRTDGKDANNLVQMDPKLGKSMKDESGRLFRDCTVITNKINELHSGTQQDVLKIVTLVSEAEQYSMQGVDPQKYINDLAEIKAEAQQTHNVLSNTKLKMNGMARRIGQILDMAIDNDQKLQALELLETKQFLPRVKILSEKARAPGLLERQVKAIPSRTVNEYKDVKTAQSNTIKEVQSLKSTFTTVQEMAKQIGKAFPVAKKSLT